MGPYHRSLLITVLVLLLVSSGTSQSIRIGKTIARVGASAPYSLAQEQGYEVVWRYILNLNRKKMQSPRLTGQ